MDKHYDAKVVENKWYKWWEESGLFGTGESSDEQKCSDGMGQIRTDARGSQGDNSRTPELQNSRTSNESYSVVIPPPNVTGILHMGHALNNTIQDVLVRWRRMQGRDTVWIPGTDHAGIATQNVVERDLREQGTTRRDLGRDKFIEKVWEWREEYGGTIVRQLRKLGASCDWERERFTMDEGLSTAVTEVFCRLYDEGLIYRGNYIVNWCPRCHTALSDEESEHQDTAGSLWHIRYPVPGGGEVVVATTRPETMLGDTAVAVNPADERYRELVGKSVVLPLTGREIPVVADDYVDREFGTGVVKITPAHDPNDFMVAQRHELPSINVMHGDGRMNSEAGEKYSGMDRFECRKQVVADLKAEGLLVKVDEHQHAVGHCYRCDTVVEPRLSKQWFVRMKPLAEPAIEAVRSGKVRFTPKRWENTYFEWMENIRDWCISRQIWWGHRIPVYTCEACELEWAAREEPESCPKCGATSNLTQDPDVLDTWFSSWLWPFSTFGWPADDEDLKRYYPTSDLTTAPDIIFFWVARMIMAGCKFMGDVPFKNVYIHGTVRDDKGRKMSKSLGNSIDPLDIIEQYSADALRFSLMQITSTGMDVYVNMEKFEIGRNFATKIWNAARFMKMHCDRGAALDWRGIAAGNFELDPSLLRDDDRHMLASCEGVVAAMTEHLEKFRLQDGALAIYDFIWNNFCDWYLEYAKGDLSGSSQERTYHEGTKDTNQREQETGDRGQGTGDSGVDGATPSSMDQQRYAGTLTLQGDNSRTQELENSRINKRREQVLTVMTSVFATALKLLHPYMPFLTEELWHQMGYGSEGESIMYAPWPKLWSEERVSAWGLCSEVTAYVDARRELVTAGRALRAEYNVAPSKSVRFVVEASDEAVAARLRGDVGVLMGQLRAGEVEVGCGKAAAAETGDRGQGADGAGGARAGGGSPDAQAHLGTVRPTSQASEDNSRTQELENSRTSEAMPGTLCKLGTIYLPLEGLVDMEAEAARVGDELAKARGFLNSVEAKLGNENFVGRAPAKVVEQQRERRVELLASIEQLEKLLATFSA